MSAGADVTHGADAPVAPRRRRRGRHRVLWTWLVAGVVVAVVGTLLIFKFGSSPGEPTREITLTAASPEILRQVTSIPASVFDAVGVASGVVPLAPPTPTAPGTAPLVLRTAGGRPLPGVLYVGTEYCSFCAAERWPLIAALSRFGTFARLYDMTSSEVDFAPGTPTFTFYGVAYRSRVLVFRGYETQSEVATRIGHRRLMAVPHHAREVMRGVDLDASFPFVDVGGRAVALRAAFSPQTLAGLSREQIASRLDDPRDPVTRAIVASANYLAAGICASLADAPPAVCASRGVRAASVAMGLRP